MRLAHLNANQIYFPRPPNLRKVNLNILLLCKAIYEEAIPVLYRFNQFEFFPWGAQSQWPAFNRFCAQVPQRSLDFIQILTIRFRATSGAANRFISVLEGDADAFLRLPLLQHLRLVINSDLSTLDLPGLAKIRAIQLQDRWRVSLGVWRDPHDEMSRSPRVWREVFDTFHEWGWEVRGWFTFVGPDRRLMQPHEYAAAELRRSNPLYKVRETIFDRVEHV